MLSRRGVVPTTDWFSNTCAPFGFDSMRSANAGAAPERCVEAIGLGVPAVGVVDAARGVGTLLVRAHTMIAPRPSKTATPSETLARLLSPELLDKDVDFGAGGASVVATLECSAPGPVTTRSPD
jgi:hypothetical protein